MNLVSSCSCLCPMHEAMCYVENKDAVGTAPTGDAPTTSQWSIILLMCNLYQRFYGIYTYIQTHLYNQFVIKTTLRCTTGHFNCVNNDHKFTMAWHCQASRYKPLPDGQVDEAIWSLGLNKFNNRLKFSGFGHFTWCMSYLDVLVACQYEASWGQASWTCCALWKKQQPCQTQIRLAMTELLWLQKTTVEGLGVISPSKIQHSDHSPQNERTRHHEMKIWRHRKLPPHILRLRSYLTICPQCQDGGDFDTKWEKNPTND